MDTKECESLLPALREADEAASVAHDFIHGSNGVTADEASTAIWRIHSVLRPLIDPSGLTWVKATADAETPDTSGGIVP